MASPHMDVQPLNTVTISAAYSVVTADISVCSVVVLNALLLDGKYAADQVGSI